MALWGITTADESKPKYLTQEEKNRTIAKQDGWNLRTTIGARIQDEILVATTPGTAGARFLTTALAEATISAVHFGATTYAQADATAEVVVVYNELVDVTVGATLVLSGSVTGVGAITATAAAQTAVNQVKFVFTVPSQTETLSIPAGSITGTIVDTGTAVVSDKTFVSGDVIDAGGAGTGGTATIAVA